MNMQRIITFIVGLFLFSRALNYGLTLAFLAVLIMKIASVAPVASWSWWWVMSPAWMPVALIFSLFVGLFAFVGIFGKKVEKDAEDSVATQGL